MTWGLACADFYSFGSFSTTSASNGTNAPVGGTVADVSSDQPEIVSVVDYDPATVASPGFSVTVTQLAGSVDTKLVTSGDGLTAADFVNGGAAFYLKDTTHEGSPLTIPFAETVTGTPPNVVYSDGWTLAEGAAAINAEDLGLLASVEADPDAGDLALVVAGAAGDSRDFSLGAFTDVSLGGQSVDQSLADLQFGEITTKTDPVQAQYTVTGSGSGDGSFQSDLNEITVDGITVQLADLGTSTLSVSQLQGGIGGTGGTGGTGGIGAMGGTGGGLHFGLETSTISADLIFQGISTGGIGGEGGQGGLGGTGGAGADAVAAVQSSSLLPEVVSAAGNTGGIGGVGGIGGLGGERVARAAQAATLSPSPILSPAPPPKTAAPVGRVALAAQVAQAAPAGLR